MSTSRAFRVRGPDQPAAQLPLIDMCNHSFAPNCQVPPQHNVVPRFLQQFAKMLLIALWLLCGCTAGLSVQHGLKVLDWRSEGFFSQRS